MKSSASHSSVSIAGAGGHARSVIALVKSLGIEVNAVFDDSFTPGVEERISGVEIRGSLSDLPRLNILLALGDNLKRQMLFEKFFQSIYLPNLIHSSAILLSEQLGMSNLIFPRTVINAESVLGDNNIINTGCIIEHECVVGNHCHISIGSILAGRVQVGNGCFIGAGAIVRDKVKISDKVVIGAGAVVVKDITESGTYAGIPAKRIQ